MIPQGSVVNYTQALCELLGTEPGWQYATVSTLAADLGNTAIFCALASGGCVHVLDYETVTSVEAMTQWVEQHPIDVLKIVPSHLSALLAGERARELMPRQALVLGGEALPTALLKQIQELLQHPTTDRRNEENQTLPPASLDVGDSNRTTPKTSSVAALGGTCRVYNISRTTTHYLPGPLNIEALARSFEEIIHRHESLRTTFTIHKGQPIQIIHQIGRYCLPLVDLSELTHEQRERERQRLAMQETHIPFDLEQGPLLRTYLLRLGTEEHVLLLTLHHIITDGWSNEVLIHELVTLYQAFAVGLPSPLAPLSVQYADYALWQREWLQGEVLDAQLDYWEHRLSGAPPIELPTDYPHPPVRSSQGATHTFRLSAELSQALLTLSLQNDVTLFMMLLAAFRVLLYRYTEQVDIVVGTDSANRIQIETEGIVGFFVNLLALRTDLSGKPSFCEVLRRVQEVVLGAYIHQETPFELLVEKLAPDRLLDSTPLVQVLFVLQNRDLALEKVTGPARNAEQERTDQPSPLPQVNEETLVKFDLALFMREHAGALSGVLQYRRDLFKASTIATMMARFQVLLQSIVQQPDIPINLLEITPDAERAQQEQERREFRQNLRVQGDIWFDLPNGDVTRESLDG